MNPSEGAVQCSAASYQTCSADGGTCGADPNAVCSLSDLTAWTLDNKCSISTPTDDYLGCWQPLHKNNTDLLALQQVLQNMQQYRDGLYYSRVNTPTSLRGAFGTEVRRPASGCSGHSAVTSTCHGCGLYVFGGVDRSAARQPHPPNLAGVGQGPACPGIRALWRRCPREGKHLYRSGAHNAGLLSLATRLGKHSDWGPGLLHCQCQPYGRVGRAG